MNAQSEAILAIQPLRNAMLLNEFLKEDRKVEEQVKEARQSWVKFDSEQRAHVIDMAGELGLRMAALNRAGVF